jgi:putative ABC transport system substrate-binding protein
MRNIIFPLIFSFLLICGYPAYAKDIVVIQSCKIKPYEEALQGFKSVCAGKFDELVFHEQDIRGDVHRDVRRLHPDLILAIGMDALAKAKGIKNIPIVYLMVLNPQSLVHGAKNITGVSMNIPPEKHFSVLHKTLPGIKRIGLLYDPRRNDFYAKKALSSAKAHGFELIAKEAYNAKDVPGLLEYLNGKIDLLWVLPDITIVTPETTAFLLLYSVEKKVPVHIFSSKYLEMGALSSLEPDPFDMGRQAGEMAVKIISGSNVSEIAGTDALNPVLSVNMKVAKKLDIAINADTLRKARAVR